MLSCVDDGLLDLCVSDHLLNEIEHVLVERKGLSPAKAKIFRDAVASNATRTVLQADYEALAARLSGPDPYDLWHLAAAIEAGATVIVTGNITDFTRPHPRRPRSATNRHPRPTVRQAHRRRPPQRCPRHRCADVGQVKEPAQIPQRHPRWPRHMRAQSHRRRTPNPTRPTRTGLSQQPTRRTRSPTRRQDRAPLRDSGWTSQPAPCLRRRGPSPTKSVPIWC